LAGLCSGARPADDCYDGVSMSPMASPTPGSGSRLKGFLGAYQKMLDGFTNVCVVITGVALIVLTVIFGWLVFGRYVLNATPTWVEQVSLLLVAFITFLGAAVGIHENTHLGVSFFRELCPPGLRKIFIVVSHGVMAIFGGVMAVAGYQLAVFKWGTEIPLIHVPEGLRAIPISVCGVLIVLFSIGHLLLIAQGVEEVSDITE